MLTNTILAKQLLKLIEEAFAVLGNQTLRQAYDEKLRLKDKWGVEKDVSAIDPSFGLESAPATDADWSSPQTETLAPDSNHQASQPSWVAKDEKNSNEKSSSEDSSLAKTKISTYQIDDSFEAEIASQQIFDGSFLKRIREYRNISLIQISEASRIGRNYLNAIESNTYSDLPAPVFVRGFIVQISRLLEIDEKKVAASYIKLMKESLND